MQENASIKLQIELLDALTRVQHDGYTGISKTTASQLSIKLMSDIEKTLNLSNN